MQTLRFASLLLLAALGAAQLSAQATDQNAPPPPPAGAQEQASAPNGYYANPPGVEAEADAEYAFRMRTWGLNAEIGGDLGSRNSFLGFQYEYYGPRADDFAPFGDIHSRENIDTYELAYRFTAPLSQYVPSGGLPPISLYGGLSAGIGTVQLRQNAPFLGFSTEDRDRGEFAAGGVIGLQWAAARNISVKAGWRYIYINRVRLFDERANIDTGAAELGVNFKW